MFVLKGIYKWNLIFIPCWLFVFPYLSFWSLGILFVLSLIKQSSLKLAQNNMFLEISLIFQEMYNKISRLCVFSKHYCTVSTHFFFFFLSAYFLSFRQCFWFVFLSNLLLLYTVDRFMSIKFNLRKKKYPAILSIYTPWITYW